MQRIDLCGEGPTDSAIARRLIEHVGAVPGIDYVQLRSPRGKAQLDRRLAGFAVAARHGARLLILRDLDADAPCAGELATRLLPDRPARLLLRILVRSAEAWLMADREGLARALHVAAGAVPAKPEEVAIPKQRLAEIARTSSSRGIRRVSEGTPQQMTGWTMNFVQETWSIERALATGAAPSPSRAITRLRDLARQ